MVEAAKFCCVLMVKWARVICGFENSKALFLMIKIFSFTLRTLTLNNLLQIYLKLYRKFLANFCFEVDFYPRESKSLPSVPGLSIFMRRSTEQKSAP